MALPLNERIVFPRYQYCQMFLLKVDLFWFKLELSIVKILLYGYFSFQKGHSEKGGFKVMLSTVELLASSSRFGFFFLFPLGCQTVTLPVRVEA